jgi:hypothetical protein
MRHTHGYRDEKGVEINLKRAIFFNARDGRGKAKLTNKALPRRNHQTTVGGRDQ